MAANELQERLAAACWVQCGGGDGEAVNALDVTRLRFRSLVGFQQRIITTTNAQAMPVLILPLDRTLTRTECAVFATRLGTAGPDLEDFENRAVYPDLLAPVPDVAQVFVQPILLEWLGPDLANPTFFPFGIVNGVIPRAPPVGANLNLFDAIAVLLPANVSLPVPVGQSGDFCVVVLKHPPLELDTEIVAELPSEPADVFAVMRAWFRADTFTESGGELASLNGLVGDEGDLVAGEGFGLPVADPLLNNQLATPPENGQLSSTAPAGFWDFLVTGSFTFYGVAYPTIDNSLENLWQYGALFLELSPSSTDGSLLAALSTRGSAELEYPDTDINVGQWTKIVLNTALPATGLQLVNTAAGTDDPQPVGAAPAPGVQLQVMGSGGGNELVIAELMFWDFALSPVQQAEVETYLSTRYATPDPPADPILALEPTAWFRGDTFTQSGGFTQALTGRVGSEGNLVAQIAAYALPAAQAAANNQLGLQYGNQANNNLVSDVPAAFWDFLQTEDTFFSAIFLVPGAGIQRVFTTSADDVALKVDSTGVESAQVTWGAAGVNAQFSQAFPAANIGVKQYSTQRQQAGEPSPILWDLFPAAGQNGGPFLVAPPGNVVAPLQLGNTTGGAQLGAIVLLDLIFFDRALSSGEIAVWDDYISTRYGPF
jgi:hypothetical protein